jgi:Tfp pilus assembly protein PilF
LGRATRIAPKFAPAHLNLGLALSALNRPMEALARYDAAIAHAPDLAEAHYNRGVLLRTMGRDDAALASFDRALALRPDDPEALNNRGLTLDALKRHAEALQSFDDAVRLRPDFGQALSNRGNTLNWLHRPADALASFDQAVAVDPGLAEAWCNRGDTLHEQGRFHDALTSFDRAIALRPNFAEAHYGRGLTLLMLGRYPDGLRAYEWRRRRSADRALPERGAPWVGQLSLAGRTLLIQPELYLGDMIQFCRYALLARNAGASVKLAALAPLRDVLRSLGPDITIVEAGARPGAADLHCPLLSLPLAFGTTAPTIPAAVPYLHAEPARIETWRQIIGPEGLRVGICWQGSPSRADLERAFPLILFEPLSRLPGVRLISLQTGFGLEQLAELPVVEHFDDASDGGHRPFVETAAMLANLDLVITTDTSIAHLAGAMGRPTWIVLRHVPDWRWGPAGETTAWYPTARLFRQPVKGDWRAVFAEMTLALRARSPDAIGGRA